MPFLDEVVISISSGSGGAGCVSFLREKFMPRGGPDGGAGGRGGHVYLVARSNLTTLDCLGGRRRFDAESGQPGSSEKCQGRNGRDLTVELPVGTQVRDFERGHLLLELLQLDEPVLFLEGGYGGRGNAHFASPTRRAPRNAEEGRAGQERRVRLELSILADVGLLGIPNAGKSTLLSCISRARPKIGVYPFTTLAPGVGVVEHLYETLTVADLPGLLEGAHGGRGLGDRFLRHVERTRVLLHLIDAAEADVEALVSAYRTVRDELEAYGRGVPEKPELVLLTKMDRRLDPAPVEEMSARIGRPVLAISSHTNDGVPELVGKLFQWIAAERAAARVTREATS